MSDPRPQSVKKLLLEIDRMLRQVPPPWKIYAAWRDQQQLLQRAYDVLSLWPATNDPPPQQASREALAEIMQVDILSPLQKDIQRLSQQRQQLQQAVEQLSLQRDQQQAQVMQPLIAQVEQLELFQKRADQTLQSLDSSLQLTFRTLDQDMQAYEHSLLQRLRQMDDWSQQSETIVMGFLQQVLGEVRQLSPTEQQPSEMLPPFTAGTSEVEQDGLNDAGQTTSAAVSDQTITTLAEVVDRLGLHESQQLPGSTPDASTTSSSDTQWTLAGLSDLFDAPDR